jgi:hypothetical protein
VRAQLSDALGIATADENFELAQGYPEAGRNAYVRLRLNF